MKRWLAAASLWAFCGVLLLPLFLPVLNADGTSYISIAVKYYKGDFLHAVNGYWGPLLSWLMVPLLALRIDPVAAARIAILLAGFPMLWAVRRFSAELDLGEPLSSLLLLACLPIGLYMAFTMITPDFLVTAILLAYLAVFLAAGFPRHWTSGLGCGALGAFAYFAKPYAFFFFLAHFSLGIALRALTRRTAAERRRLLTAGLAGLAVFAVLSCAWIGLISLKYHHFLINSAGRYNISILRPGSPGQPIQTSGFLPPPNATASSAWEDPALIPLPDWSPIRSKADFIYFLGLMGRNSRDFIAGLDDFSPLGPLIFLGGLGIVVAAAARRFSSRPANRLAALIGTLVVYSLGYGFLRVEDRYLWLDDFLLLLTAVGLVSFLLSRRSGWRWPAALAALPILASFLILPANFFPYYRVMSTSETMFPARATRDLALRLKEDYRLSGRFASSGYWNESMIIAAFDHLQYYGQMRPEWSALQLEAELKKHGVRYFFLWRHNDSKFDFLKNKYIELTKGEVPGLEIYLLKERPNADSPRARCLHPEENPMIGRLSDGSEGAVTSTAISKGSKMSVAFQHRTAPCPLCGSSETSRSRLIKGFLLADCAVCGLRYVRDRVPEDEIMEYYRYEYFHSSGDPTNGYADYFQIRKERERTFARHLKIILPLVERREDVLDIGCGAGYFLNASRPYFKRLTGVDVSPEALGKADPSYRTICSEFRSGLLPPGFADLIMLSDVVEHLYHPVEFLAQVKEVLHPGGLICIITPTRRSLLARASGRRSVSYKLPEHVSYFDPATLERMLAEAGLGVRGWRPCGQFATIDFIAKRLNSLFFGRRDAFLVPSSLRGRMLYVNTGSMLALAGHRVC